MNTSGRFEIQNLGQMILALQVCGFPDTLIEPVQREYSLCVDAGMSEALLQFRIDHLHRLIARASAFDEANWDFALRVFYDRDRDPEAASELPSAATEESPANMWRDYCDNHAYLCIRWQVYSEARSFTQASRLRQKPRSWTKEAINTFNRVLDDYVAAFREAESKTQDTKRGSGSMGDDATDSAVIAATAETPGGPPTSATSTGDSVGASAEHIESAVAAAEDDERSNSTNTGTTKGALRGDAL
jgi:hypothetical protein